MDIEKELALTFDFETAPESFKQAAADAKNLYFRVKKAHSQIELWTKELIAAQKSLDQASKYFRSELNKWDPLGLKEGKIEDKT